MANKIWSVVLLLLSLYFCHAKPAVEEARQMARSYAACTARYDRLEEEYNAKTRNTRPGQNSDKTSAAYNRILASKKTELEKLLRENEKSTSSNELELLRSKILIEIGRTVDAEKIVDRISMAQSGLALEAKLQKVLIHLINRRSAAALALFKEIEPLIKKDTQFFNICLALSHSGPEAKVREEYALKFLASPELPAALQPYKTMVYASLATQAKDDRQPEKARDYFEKALALSSDPAWRVNLEAGLKQIALIDHPAPPLQVETWFNQQPLTLAALKGQVVVIDFWAPWCAPCRMLMPALQEELSQFKDQGFQVIGCTKLYGRYSDGVSKKDKIDAAEELTLIKNYLDKNRISYPVAVGAEGLSFDTYVITAVPSLVFIDRRGNVAFIQSGAVPPRQIREQIKSLLAGK